MYIKLYEIGIENIKFVQLFSIPKKEKQKIFSNNQREIWEFLTYLEQWAMDIFQPTLNTEPAKVTDFSKFNKI